MIVYLWHRWLRTRRLTLLGVLLLMLLLDLTVGGALVAWEISLLKGQW
jgi:hypothetical protein